MIAANRAASSRGFELSALRIGQLMREQHNLGFVDVGSDLGVCCRSVRSRISSGSPHIAWNGPEIAPDIATFGHNPERLNRP
jgi:hypothetical protein